jgi:transposase
MADEHSIEKRIKLMPFLDERQRRLFAAGESEAEGPGSITKVAKLTGLARSTIRRGVKDLAEPSTLPVGRIRRPGGGRKFLAETDPTLVCDLEALIEPDSRGDPMSPLRWTCKTLRNLARELQKLGHEVSYVTVRTLLKKWKYSLQANQKTKEGDSHPDRDAQFRHINETVRSALAENQPVISVDTKKKELVGDFRNGGQEWRPKGDPEEVRVHDFLIKELGRAVPYGIYDLAANKGWVSVGMSADTAEFAVQTIRSWWQNEGRDRYPKATRLVITADGGGSNGSRVRLWKLKLQELADEIGIKIVVRHLPPGTSKWNKIEHKLFSFISMNWRARPLISYQVILQLISATTTESGLTVRCQLDPNIYTKGIVVTDK